MIKATIRGAGYPELRRALRERLPFKTGGALYGTDKSAYTSYGHLNDSEVSKFERDRERMTFIVYSYATPIAWALDDGTVHKVDQRFSVTTSRHQSFLYLLDD